jgi:tetratricopeptide (TPR) repeat protein
MSNLSLITVIILVVGFMWAGFILAGMGYPYDEFAGFSQAISVIILVTSIFIPLILNQRKMRIAKQTIERNPEDGEAYFQLGEAYYDFSKFIEAGECYAKAVNLRPRDPNARYMLGITHWRRRNTEELGKECKILEEIDRELAERLMKFYRKEQGFMVWLDYDRVYTAGKKKHTDKSL